MRYRKLDANGDYTFGNGQQDFYRDVPQAVQQAVVTRLGLWEGEWYLDTSEGTKYQTGVLGKRTEEEANTTLRNRIRGTQGLLEILSYDYTFNRDTRKLAVETEIDTIYGIATVQGVF